MIRILCLFSLFIIVYACSPDPGPALQDRVTIYRDEFGVAHVYGEDDESAAFGYAYAMAEDNFRLILENYIHALGRSTELIGEKGLMDDWLNRSLEITRHSREEFDQLSPDVQAICRGYAAGLNYYVQTHPEADIRILSEFEPWHPLAFINYLYYQRGFLPSSNIPYASVRAAFRKLNHMPGNELTSLVILNTKNEGEGSNSWAVNGSKSASGNAMLFINPHLPWFGSAQVYEAHIMSKTGWNFTGYTRFGFPLPYVGHNEHLGWASTNNDADLVDTYYEYFTHEEDSLAYEYEDGYRQSVTWNETIQILADSGMADRELTFLKTHHGPVLGFQNDQPVTVRLARYETPGWMEQWYRMTRAGNLSEFREAVSPLEVQFGNFMYADQEGNIWYVYNGAIPKRDESFDWEQPVPGNTAQTEWKGYHTLDELPQIFNPGSHWMQNCNGTPVLGSEPDDSPGKEDFPSYMIVEPDNARSEYARRILRETEVFTYDTFRDSTYSTYLISAEKDIPVLRREARDRELTPAQQEAIDMLSNWDRISRLESVETTLYILMMFSSWRDAARSDSDSISLVTGLLNAMQDLQETRGSWMIPWGEMQRLQRPAQHAFNEVLFNDSLPSIPLTGTPSWTGASFISNARPNRQGNKYMYGIHGNSYVSIVEFGDRIRSGSLHPFGPDSDPESAHYFDQADRFVNGKYKPAYTYLEDVVAAAVETYAPGKRTVR